MYALRPTASLTGLLVLVAGVLSAADPKAPAEPLNVSLFGYVPDQALMEKTIRDRWDKVSKVPLKFVSYNPATKKGWDGYRSDPEAAPDVFEIDAINLEFFARNNYAAVLDPREVDNAEDFFDFAWKGGQMEGQLYGIPRLACLHLLFYRDGDAAVENTAGLTDLHKLLGDGPEKLPPEKGKGLLLDLRGSTTCACLYLDAVADSYFRNSARIRLPAENELDGGGVANLRLLARMAGKPGAEVDDELPDGSSQRATWFGSGLGRCYVGFSERLYYLPKAVHPQTRVRRLPLGDTDVVNLCFVDVLMLNPLVRGERRKAALQLMNLVAARETMVACLMPQGDKPSQYLLSVRPSVYQDAVLLKQAPLYRELATMVGSEAKPRAFRLGPESRDWLSMNKRVRMIQDLLFPMGP